MDIQFSPNVIKILPLYLYSNWQQLIRESKFRYTKSYIYNCITGKSLISHQMNMELNILWNSLELDYSDLENIYTLINIAEVGNIKYKKFKGGK
jgi:hypothetical protein